MYSGLVLGEEPAKLMDDVKQREKRQSGDLYTNTKPQYKLNMQSRKNITGSYTKVKTHIVGLNQIQSSVRFEAHDTDC